MKYTLSTSAQFGDKGALSFFFVVVELPPKPLLLFQAMIQHLFFPNFSFIQPFLFEKQSLTIAILPWPVARHPRAGARRLTDTPGEGKVRDRNILDTCLCWRPDPEAREHPYMRIDTSRFE